MAIVTDPDNLDRGQVLVDYENEFISIKNINTDTPKAGPNGTGVQVAGDAQLTDNTAGLDFTASGGGVSAGDVLVIFDGPNINHWPVSGATANVITVETGVLGAFQGNYTGQYVVCTSGSSSVEDGATLQAIYSFLKEEWKTQISSGNAGALVDLIQFIFPLESITREQFEIGGATHSNWDWKNDETRNLIRTAGWNKLDAAGTTQQQYAGVITLGSLDSDTQVYYQQINSTSGTTDDPKNFVLLGAVNQAILFNDPAGTVNNQDNSQFLKLFARKKGKTYPQSEIGDIGVTDLENIVNRFPLTHADDPAIIETDGTLAGTGVWQTTTTLFSDNDGSTSAQASSQQEQTFTFTSAGNSFSGSGVIPGDVLATGATPGSYTLFEIVTVGSTTLDCLQEPGVSIATNNSIPFEVWNKRPHGNLSDGTATASGASAETGIFSSAGAGFSDSGIIKGDILAILNADSEAKGVYKVLSVINNTGLGIDTTDQSWVDEYSSLTYEVYNKGMYLQYKSETGTPHQGNIQFDASQSRIISSGGSTVNFSTEGFLVGGVVKVGQAEDAANNGDYRISGFSTVNATNDTLVIDGSLTFNADDTTAILSGINGFIRTPAGGTQSTYNWRLFGNGGTLAECFQWIQKQLRRGFVDILNDADGRRITDIDNASGIFRGDVSDLLMTFASPNGTALNMFIDDLAAADSNNVTFEDLLGIDRNNAFIVALTININSNLVDDTSSKLVVFFTNDDDGSNEGRDYDTPDAIIVQEQDGSEMISTDLAGDRAAPVSNNNLVFQYDYDNNQQRGNSSAVDAPITTVAIGTSGAQWVRSNNTIDRQNTVTVSLVAALERNYSNP